MSPEPPTTDNTHETPPDADTRLSAVFGYPRSGTTWLGSLIDTHPRVAYRFEPFHRVAPRNPTLQSIREKLSGNEASAADIDALRRVLLPADPMLERPPFFAKRLDARCSIGRSWLRPLWQKARPLHGLYGWLYSPRAAATHVVFKEVDCEREMIGAFGGSTHAIRGVYLLRHPCGVLRSIGEGQSQGLMPTARERVVGGLIAELDPPLSDAFGPRIDAMNRIERQALLWRLGADIALRLADQTGGRLLPVFYENLCDDTLGTMRRVFAHLGLEMTDATGAYIDASTSGQSHRKSMWTRGYFSTFRDTRAVMDRWKSEMPAEQQARVLAIVRDSAAFRLGVERAGWPDAPIDA